MDIEPGDQRGLGRAEIIAQRRAVELDYDLPLGVAAWPAPRRYGNNASKTRVSRGRVISNNEFGSTTSLQRPFIDYQSEIASQIP